jgi:Putative nucleotidyltransferase DUF294
MATRRDYSLGRLAELGSRLDPVHDLLTDEPLCVYATGSYGRLEAWRGSDADLFFLYDDVNADDFSWLKFTRLVACLVDATEAMEFPPFSGDGKYLEVLYVGEMEKVLGSRGDDSTNAFTARMLLLLESRPVYDADLHARLLERIVGFYYRDFADHADDFVPGFLINDILRFWRTLTLNYEHDRHGLQRKDLTVDELRSEKAKSALKNYKLKFSRMTTCFSMVANLASEPRPVTAAVVVELCRMTPAERLARLVDRGESARAIVERLEDAYETFLVDVQRPETDLLADFANGDTRREKLDRAGDYGDLIYDLLRVVVDDRRMRYLVV